MLIFYDTDLGYIGTRHNLVPLHGTDVSRQRIGPYVSRPATWSSRSHWIELLFCQHNDIVTNQSEWSRTLAMQKHKANSGCHLIRCIIQCRGPNTPHGLRRRYTIRFARTEPADCPVHGSIVTCDMSLECPGHVKIGWKGFTARSIFEPILPPELCDCPIRAQHTPKTTFTLYDCERETGRV